jgi:hypothetical protein
MLKGHPEAYNGVMPSDTQFTRRQALAAIGAIGGAIGVAAHGQAAAELYDVVAGAVERNDAATTRLLATQITDPASAWRGGIPDQFGLHGAGAAGGLTETLASSFVHPQSKFHGDTALVERIRLAAGFLERSQSPQGNIDLPSTNFNSPPDTGFVVHSVATAAAISKGHGAAEITAILRPFLVKAGGALATGGIHTPNHRWVVSAALAQIHELFPDPRYVRRIDEWLAEGIDIDADGQFSEQSTLVYNRVCDRAFIVLAAKLNRPELLDPVRKNLQALLYLLHANGEVVTDISHRQDQFTRGDAGGYWFPFAYMALRDGDGRFANLASSLAAKNASLSSLLEYPELLRPLPASAPLPDDFEKQFGVTGMIRIRRGLLSATLTPEHSSRVFAMQYGDAVITAVRFATSFFGKGQFIPAGLEQRGGVRHFSQSLEGPYYQPVARRVTRDNWAEVRRERRQTEMCKLDQSLEVSEIKNGFRLRVRASGTPNVPLAIEIGFREGGQLEGCVPAPTRPGMLLASGMGVYRVGRHAIRFGPGAAPHQYTELRGAETPLPGQSVYITGLTPFDHTFTVEGGT